MRRGVQRMNRYKTRNEIIREKLKQLGRKVCKKKKKTRSVAAPAGLMTNMSECVTKNVGITENGEF